MGVTKIKWAKGMKRIAEERVSKKFPNLKVLNSYLLWSDGKFKWYEVLLLDPNHPVISKSMK